MTTTESGIELDLISKLQELKYSHRPDIRDRAALEQNFREKFESLNRVKLTDSEFARLLDDIVSPDVFTAAKTLREISAFTRDDGTPLNYTLVNIRDWCKNTFEVVNQLRINTDCLPAAGFRGGRRRPIWACPCIPSMSFAPPSPMCPWARVCGAGTWPIWMLSCIIGNATTAPGLLPYGRKGKHAYLQASRIAPLVSEITAGVIQDFVDERSRSVKRDTVKRDVTTLKAILNKAVREGFLDRLPAFPRFRREKARTRWLTPEEVDRLVAAAAKHLRPLIRFAVDTGGRRGELLSLDWRYVDMRGKRITFTDTKNGEDRTVRLCDRAVAILAALGPKDSGPVFTFRGSSMKEITNGFQTARRKAGLPDVRFHDLRHTFASRLVQGGVPLYTK